MEISTYYLYYPAKLAPEAEGQEPQPAGDRQPRESVAPGELAAEEKIDLVRQQNLVSPPQEPVDLTRAAELLRQVQAELNGWGKSEAQELYHYDRLRELLYQVSQPLEV